VCGELLILGKLVIRHKQVSNHDIVGLLTLLDLVVDTPNPMAARRTSWLLAALIAFGTALAVPLPRVWRPAEACAIALLSESDCETEAPSEHSNLTLEFAPFTDCLRYEPRASSRRFWATNDRRQPPFPSLA
jgi:hypothetical protein